LVRVLEESPNGPGLVLRVGPDEVFLPADHAASWLGKLGFTIVFPIKWAFAAKGTNAMGPIRLADDGIEVDLGKLSTPDGRRQFAEIMLENPGLRERLGVRRRPDGELEFDGGEPGELDS